MSNVIVSVDLEMTGLKVKQDRILEIGAVKIEDGQLTETFQTLVNPHRELDESIIKLTGITNEMARAGVDEIDAFQAFLEFAGEAPLLGHNIMFDYAFLKQCAVNHKYSFERDGIDTLKLARTLCGAEPEKKTLDSLCDYFQIYREQNHRALEDAKATAQLYLILQKKAETLAAEGQPTQEKLLNPHPLQYHVKKQGPATPAQKRDLNHFIIYHRIDLGLDINTLTKGEASRLIEKLSQKYGKIVRSKDSERPIES